MIGTTNAWQNVLAFHDYDVQSFTTDSATSDTLGDIEVYENVHPYGHVYTGAVNATKTDANGDPLSGAIFALQDNTSSQWVTALTADAGPTFATITPTQPSYSNVYTVLSDNSGMVSFDGVEPGHGYKLVEAVAPTNYKLLPATAMPVITAVSLPWAEQNTATGPNTITKIVNVPKLALPNTGGTGQGLIIGVGICLLTAAALAKNSQRKRGRVQ